MKTMYAAVLRPNPGDCSRGCRRGGQRGMGRRVRLVVGGALLWVAAGAATPLAAQTAPVIRPGDTIRLTSPLLPERTVVEVVALRGDTLLAMGPDNQRLVLPLTGFERLEVPRKDRITGAVLGAPVGALAVTTVLAVWAHSQGGWLDCARCPFRDDFFFSAIFGVPIGGIGGALTGAAVGVRRWDPVPHPVRR
jgi:hypothetical protein